jgi:tRNA threonylcarbamoyladenosine biosynthesis protein TsaB
MAWILNIETSTHVCSVSLSQDGMLVDTKESSEDKSHARLLTLFIQDILDSHKLKVSSLDAIAVSKRPLARLLSGIILTSLHPLVLITYCSVQ